MQPNAGLLSSRANPSPAPACSQHWPKPRPVLPCQSSVPSGLQKPCMSTVCTSNPCADLLHLREDNRAPHPHGCTSSPLCHDQDTITALLAHLPPSNQPPEFRPTWQATSLHAPTKLPRAMDQLFLVCQLANSLFPMHVPTPDFMATHANRSAQQVSGTSALPSHPSSNCSLPASFSSSWLFLPQRTSRTRPLHTPAFSP